MRFEWNAAKAQSNCRKHGVGFDEACSVFSDADGLLIADPDHSGKEERFLLLGMSYRWRVLVVVHCERSENKEELVLRIISARKATASENRQYGGRKP